MQILIIGGGPAGYEAALHAARRGAGVTLVEKAKLGGTCLQAGCIPTKALLASAEALHTLQNPAEFGLAAGADARPDWPAILARKNKTVAQLAGGVQRALSAAGVQLLQGTATLQSPGSARVELSDGSSQTLQADAILLATGSVPFLPAFLLAGGSRVLSSDALLNLPQLPASAIVAGGGVMGCEFAQLLARLGCDVALLEMLPHLLPGEDEDVAKALERRFRRERIRTFCGRGIARVEQGGAGIRAVLTDGKELEAELLVAAMGRRPNTAGLGLEATGIQPDENGYIPADEHMQTAAAGIWAAGDILRTPQLAHVATREALTAIDNMLGNTAAMSYRAVPRCTYTEPEIACVGATEKELATAGIPYKAGRFEMPGNGRARAMGKTDGFAKVLTDETGALLGAAIVGACAAEMLPLLTLGIQRRMTAAELAAPIFPHPSLSEALQAALLAAVEAPLS